MGPKSVRPRSQTLALLVSTTSPVWLLLTVLVTGPQTVSLRINLAGIICLGVLVVASLVLPSESLAQLWAVSLTCGPHAWSAWLGFMSQEDLMMIVQRDQDTREAVRVAYFMLGCMHGRISTRDLNWKISLALSSLALGCVGNALTLVWRLGDAWLARLPLFNMLMFMYVCIPFLVGFAIAHAAATETTYLHSKLSRVTTQLDEVQRLTRELENARRVSLLASATATATATSKQLEALEGATLLHLDAQSVDDSSDTCSELTEFTASPVVSRRNDLRPCVKMLLDGLEPTTGSIDLSVEQLYSAIPQFDLSDVDVRLTSAERQNLLLSVSASGDLTSAAGEPLNTHDDLANFVLLEDGSLYVSIKKLHHHQLAGCAPIVAAGEMTIHDGELRTITNGSGHYRPSPECLDVVLSVLRARGARVLPTLQVQKFTVTGSPLAPLD